MAWSDSSKDEAKPAESGDEATGGSTRTDLIIALVEGESTQQNEAAEEEEETRRKMRGLGGEKKPLTVQRHDDIRFGRREHVAATAGDGGGAPGRAAGESSVCITTGEFGGKND